jgi:hypothetical protein
MQIPSIKLRNKYTGKIRIVNQTFYADHLGSWADWEVVSMRGGTAPDYVVAQEREQERIERARIANPKSPASGDAERACTERAVSITTTAPVVENPEFTQAVMTPIVEPEPEVQERAVPTIGGSQVVRMRGRKPKNASDEIL